MPRLTSRVFTDLAIWMAGFGLLIGLIFPPFCLLLGLPAERVISPLFYGATLTAGAVVGAVNFALARLVVGRRLRGHPSPPWTDLRLSGAQRDGSTPRRRAAPHCPARACCCPTSLRGRRA